MRRLGSSFLLNFVEKVRWFTKVQWMFEVANRLNW